MIPISASATTSSAITVDGRTTAFAVNTGGKTITFHGYSSDALILARCEDTTEMIAALATTLADCERTLLQTDKPVVVHHSSTGAHDTFNLHVKGPGTIRFGVHGKPRAVTVNGAVIETASRSSGDSWVDISLPGGVSVVEFSSIFL